MKNIKTARRYAHALLDVAMEKNIIEKVYEDLTGLQTILEATPEFKTFLSNPIIKTEQKKNTFKMMFDKTISPTTLRFLYTLCEKNRENILPEVVEAFIEMRDEQSGLIKAEVISATDLSKTQADELSKKIKAMTGKIPQLSFRTDVKLIGGFLIRMGDTVIDGSVKHQLELLRDQFKSERVN